MSTGYSLLYFLAALAVFVDSSHIPEASSANGKHLRVLAVEFPVSLSTQRNTTGHVIYVDGPLKHHIQALSTMLNFSYSYIPVSAPVMEDSATTRGAISYLVTNEVDYLLSNSVGTNARFKNADYPANWFHGPFGCIVPYPRETLDLTSSLRPLSNQAWFFVIAATLTIVFYLEFTDRMNFRRNNSFNFKSAGRDVIGRRRVTDFVLGNLVSQGQTFYSTRPAVRIAAGAWCVGCFFLVQIYCSTLISHLMSGNQKPLANTIQELANTPGISFTVDRGYAIDIILRNMESGDLKRLADILKSNPNKLLCNKTADCLKTVREGNAAYGASLNTLKTLMDVDLKATGTCHYYLMKETFLSSPGFTLLAKNSPYTEAFSRGILRLRDSGFYNLWVSWYLPSTAKCVELNHQDKSRRLSAGHLSGAFVLLVFGYVSSAVVLFLERTRLSRTCLRKPKTQSSLSQ